MITALLEIIGLQKKADYSIVTGSTLRTIANQICLIWTGSLDIFFKGACNGYDGIKGNFGRCGKYPGTILKFIQSKQNWQFLFLIWTPQFLGSEILN